MARVPACIGISSISNKGLSFAMNLVRIVHLRISGLCWCSAFFCLPSVILTSKCLVQFKELYVVELSANIHGRCWNVLGLAIRMGQSIGLHVESSRSETKWSVDCENRRRTWYSMYVLDRLLALQLGRPMAIHETDFKVDIPSQHDQSPFGVETKSSFLENDNSHPHNSMMDYFVQVIRFSHIVGLVICELYRPSQVDLSPDQMLNNASLLDQRLFRWKAELPRHLRFDLGHTFEKSISFKRQVCNSLYHLTRV